MGRLAKVLIDSELRKRDAEPMAPEVAQWLGAQGTQHWLCSHPWLSGVMLPFLLHLLLLFLSVSLPLLFSLLL